MVWIIEHLILQCDKILWFGYGKLDEGRSHMKMLQYMSTYKITLVSKRSNRKGLYHLKGIKHQADRVSHLTE